MSQANAATVPATTSSTWPAIVKVAAVLLVMVEVAGFFYGFFYSMLSRDLVQAMLVQAHFDDVLNIENRLLGLTLAPLVYAVLAAIAPLVGWWIYSRIETPSQYAVGWGSSALFAFTYVLIGLFNQAGAARMGLTMGLLSTVLGTALIVVYTMFFMGIGFNIAKIFKLKL